MPSDLDTASDHDDSGESGEGESRGRLEGHITSADLLNPSDALDLLAQVANLEPKNQNQGDPETTNHEMAEAAMGIETGTTQSIAYYPPIASGAVSLSEAAALLQKYASAVHVFDFAILCARTDTRTSGTIQSSIPSSRSPTTPSSKIPPACQRGSRKSNTSSQPS